MIRLRSVGTSDTLNPFVISHACWKTRFSRYHHGPASR